MNTIVDNELVAVLMAVVSQVVRVGRIVRIVRIGPVRVARRWGAGRRQPAFNLREQRGYWRS